MTGSWGRREAMAAGLALLAGGRALAQTAPIDPIVAAPAPPTPKPLDADQLAVLDLLDDEAGRMTSQATVNGRGPYRFLVDTGADRSVLSEELALALGLRRVGEAHVNGITGAAMRPTVAVPRLEVGGRALQDAVLPLLPRDALGALGCIGLDCLQDQAVRIDFAAREMTVRRSRGFGDDTPGTIVVRGRSRFGQLMLVDSSVRRRPVYVVLDSGAENTMGNLALREFLLERRARRGPITPVAFTPDPGRAVTVRGVTGQTAAGERDEIEELVLDGGVLKRVPVIYADLHTFRMFRLQDDPALLLGMDVLRCFPGVSVDFGRREVRFQREAPRPGTRTGTLL